MKMKRTILTFALCAIAGCSSSTSVGEWDLDEPSAEASSGGVSDVGTDPEEELADAASTPTSDSRDVQEQVDLAPTLVCPDESTEGIADVFAYRVYREIACRRGEEENILFSPAALELAIGEWMQLVDDETAESLAAKMGYDDPLQMVEELESYRQELLERRPHPFKLDFPSGPRKYGFEEEDPERLQRALGVEFYSVECASSSTQNCTWKPQSGRWNDEEFLDDDIARAVGESPVSTQGVIVRGEWERPKNALKYQHGFVAASGSEIDIDVSIHLIDNFTAAETFYLTEWRLLGGEISVLFVGSSGLSIGAIESEFLSRPVSEWVATFDYPIPLRSQTSRVPLIDLVDTIDGSKFSAIDIPLTNTTRLAIPRDDPPRRNRGINFPDRLTRVMIEGTRQPSFAPLGESDVGGSSDHGTNEEDLPYYFSYDGPFLIVVYDHPTESILKIGRIARP